MSDMNPKIGIYKHFKGRHYKLLYMARHSESDEQYAVYVSLDDSAIWVRPLKMFTDMITTDEGDYVPRFKLIEE